MSLRGSLAATVATVATFASGLLILAAPALGAQAAEPGAFKAGQRVEVEYVPNSGKWLSATVVEPVNDGYSYKLDIAPGQGSAETRTVIHFRRVREAAPTPRPAAAAKATTAARAAEAPRAPAPTQAPAESLPMGRYGCSESRYNAGSGMYEYDAKGTIVLEGDGRYTYLGLSRPSLGRHKAAAEGGGKLSFTGGHLDGGVATPVEGRPGRFHLTAPAIGSRWTCGVS